MTKPDDEAPMTKPVTSVIPAAWRASAERAHELTCLGFMRAAPDKALPHEQRRTPSSPPPPPSTGILLDRERAVAPGRQPRIARARRARDAPARCRTPSPPRAGVAAG